MPQDSKKQLRRQQILQGAVQVLEPRHRLRSACLDFWLGWSSFSFTTHQAIHDIMQRYRRSLIGPIWLVLSTLAFIIGFVILGSLVFGVDRTQYVTYLAAGIIFWQFTVSCFNESAGMYFQNSSYILSQYTAYSSFPLRVTIRNIFVLAHNLPILIIIVIFKDSYGLNTFYIIPAFLLVMSLYFSITMLIGIVATRFRDVQPAITVFMQFMFYFTPIFWRADAIEEGYAQLLFLLNPFYHIITLLRDPFLNTQPPLLSWLVVGVMSLITFIITFLVFVRFRQRIVYWL